MGHTSNHVSMSTLLYLRPLGCNRFPLGPVGHVIVYFSLNWTHSGVPRNFVRGGSTNSVEDRDNGGLGAVAPPLVKGPGGSCNLVQEISFHKVKFS